MRSRGRGRAAGRQRSGPCCRGAWWLLRRPASWCGCVELPGGKGWWCWWRWWELGGSIRWKGKKRTEKEWAEWRGGDEIDFNAKQQPQ